MKARRCFLLLAVLLESEWLGHGGVFIVWDASSQVAQLAEGEVEGAMAQWKCGMGRRTRGDVGAVAPRRGSGGTRCRVRWWTTARQGGGGLDCHVGAAADEAMETWPLVGLARSLEQADSLPTDANFPTTWLVVDFGACKAVIRLLIDLSHINPDPIRYELLSARGTDRKQSSGDASAEFGESFEPRESARIERNVFELNAKSAQAGSPAACRLCLACSNMRGVVERTVPYPRLLPAPAFVDPLWARHGRSAQNSTGRRPGLLRSHRIERERARASADMGTSAGGPSAWLVRETRCPISPPGDAAIATPGVAS